MGIQNVCLKPTLEWVDHSPGMREISWGARIDVKSPYG